MATLAQYSRGVRRTTSGLAINRPTKVSALTVVAVSGDTLVNLRDGGSGGAIVWSAEADNATSSYSTTFNPPLRFFHNLYIEFASSDSQSSASVAVIEP